MSEPRVYIGYAAGKQLSGITLFKVTGGWQLSTREVGEDGWEVEHIDDVSGERLLKGIAAIPLEPRPRRRQRVLL